MVMYREGETDMPTKASHALLTLVAGFLVFAAALLSDESGNVALGLAVVALLTARYWARRAAGVLVRSEDAPAVHGDRMD
jgi:hypothetical protein